MSHPHPHLSSAPAVIAWEVTRRCHLKCRHCRAAACDIPYENEFSTEECRRVIDNLAAFCQPVLIFTGGEPMTRPDIYELIRYAADRGLKPVIAPCGQLLTPESVARLKEAGCLGASISLDAPDAAAHDAFRGTPGAFAGTLRGIACLREAGLPFQVNTTVTRLNADRLPEMIDLAVSLGAHTLDLFFLVPTGRGATLRDLEISPADYERLLAWVCATAPAAPLRLKTTCAPHIARLQASRGDGAPASRHGGHGGGCMGGKGFVFISHIGILQPCGFLDLPCGDLRAANYDFQKLYATSPEFLALRDVDGLHGKCGLCEYRRNCSGCRARAFARDGDWLGEEPGCVYRPRGAGAAPRG